MYTVLTLHFVSFTPSNCLGNKINDLQKHEPGNPDNKKPQLGPSSRPGIGSAAAAACGKGDAAGGGTKYGDPRKLIKIIEYDDVNQNSSHQQQQRRRHHFDYDDLPMEHGVVPEEFLRRFTDTDSRPMTPTPTVLSNKTYSSSMARHSRRCVTPEPQNVYETEKKRIILDLRRSHSQETLYWNASSEFSASVHHHEMGGGAGGGSYRRPKTTSMARELIMAGNKPMVTKRSESSSAPGGGGGGGQSLSSSGIPGNSLKPQARGTSAKCQSRVQMEQDDEQQQRNQMQKQLSCIYSKDDLDEEPRRRGKKKKRGKMVPETSTTFRPSQDPETQVANVPPDSTVQSQRPSIVANGTSMLGEAERRAAAPRGSKTSSEDLREALGKMSFLDESLLSQLRRGLSIEAIETNFQIMVRGADWG